MSVLNELQLGYKTVDDNKTLLQKIANEYPSIASYKSIGTTNNGLDIPCIKFSYGSNNKVPIIFISGIHPDELLGIEYSYDIIFNILNEYSSGNTYLLDRCDITIIPLLNPDGLVKYYNYTNVKGVVEFGRKNGRTTTDSVYTSGVDLNRNFPYLFGKFGCSNDGSKHNYKGEYAISEPETYSIMKLFNEDKFIFSISFHTFASKIIIPYNSSKNNSENYVKYLANKLAPFAKKRSGGNYSVVNSIYPVSGTDQDYFYNQYDTNAFLIEGEADKPDYSSVKKICTLISGFWRGIIDEVSNGYKIYIRVLDGNTPLSVQINIDEIKYYNNEIFFSNNNGYYIKFVIYNKIYNLTLNKVGYKPKKIQIQATKELIPVTVYMEKE